MMMATNRLLRRALSGCALFLLSATLAFAQTATLSGRVVDAADGQGLAGANIVVMSQDGGTMVAGGAASADGSYRITGIPAGTYAVAARFIGFDESRAEIALRAGENRTLDFEMSVASFDLNQVVVTASRQAEQALDAPASVSVLNTAEVQSAVTPSSVGVLRNTVGVDIAQTGVDRSEVVLRGFNNAFSGAAYTLVDYRQAAAPSLGVNIYSIMPNQSTDVDRVEVVRGPGSALYGAGVDAGVIHFITKDPFTSPGTTIAVAGGNRAMVNAQGRHAGVIGQNVGYKITGQFTRADDWEYDANDPQDAAQLDGDFGDLERNYDYQKYNVNGLLQYRISPDVTLSLNGGHSALTAVVLSGIGTLQADNFGYSYGQVRLNAGNFFTQFYVNRNNAGDSYVYGTGQKVVDKGIMYRAQAQYDLQLNPDQRFIVGGDYRLTQPDTEGTILGRNEDDDSISEIGGYIQSSSKLGEVIDVTLAVRGDYNDVVEQFQISPRIALVAKPASGQSIRATYNRSFSSPGTNSLFLDIQAGFIPSAALPGGGIVVRGRGASQGYTFRRNPDFSVFGSDLVASSLNPATLGADQPVGLPLGAVYAQVYGGLQQLDAAGQLGAILAANGINITDGQRAVLLRALGVAGGTNVQGITQGQLSILNPSTGAFTPVSDVSNVSPLEQTTTQTAELGYKGIFNNRLLVAVDGYYTRKENFVGPLLVETPFVTVPGLLADLQAAISSGISGNDTAIPEFGGATLAQVLGSLGLDADGLAQLLVGVASSQLPDAATPIAVVQPTENTGELGSVPEVLLTYRNYGVVEFFGLDASFEFLATDYVSVFGNVSLVSDNFFDNEEIDEENVDLSVALNAPRFKSRLGANYRKPGGLSANISARYTEGFAVRSGPYVGKVEDYFLLDLGAGYDLSDAVQGLRIDALVQNVLNNKHRQFFGAPELGTQVLARLTVDF